MKKVILRYIPFLIVVVVVSSCLKENKYFEDFSSTQPIADITKAPANAVNAAAPTSSWVLMDSLATGFDYKTAVHIAAKEHVGDVTIRMKIDKVAGQAWIASHSTLGYTLMPDSLYTVPSLDVLIPNAGVFTTGDFTVHVRSNVRDPATGTATVPKGASIFKTFKFILPVSIDTVTSAPYTTASNFRTILWYMRVK